MGIFSKFAAGLKKARENFTKKIKFLFLGSGELDDDFYDELEELLITSDYGAKTSEEIIEQLKDAAYDQGLRKREPALELFKQILIDLIDFDVPPLEYPAVILLSGVNGVGKTTAIGKLASFYKSQGKSVVLAAADTFRAAAAEQLTVWAERAGVRIIKQAEGSDPAAVVYDAVRSAKANKTDVLLIDTAGRLHNKKNLMEELKKINRVVMRDYPEADYRTYIVLDATTGQNAVLQSEAFKEAIDIDGIILTKLDGTAKGGVVAAISYEQEIPIVFVGVGEGINDLKEFDATEFVEGLLE